MVVGDFAIELDTVVVGSGPGGYVAAIRASQKGQKVAIIERENIGGVCLNVGCIPSKALIAAGHHYQDAKDSEAFGIKTENATLDFSKTQEWKENQVVNKLTSGVKGLLKKNKVDVIEGEAFFVDENSLRVIHPDSAQTYTFNHAIVATGSRPIEIPGFKFGGRVIDSTGGLALEQVPEKLVIIGGGVIGAELGSAYANLGSEVTILEGTPQILPTYEKDLVKLVENDFKKRDVNIITSAMAKEAIDNGDSVTVNYEADGKQESVTADYVMVTVGRRPNTDEMGLEQAGVEIGDHGLLPVDNQGRTNVKSIFAIGDVVPGAALAHKASYEAKIAAEAISGEKVAVDYKAMPSVAFTDPEIVTVGMTINEAKEAGLDAKAYKFPFAGNGRALSLNKTEGFIRLVTTVEDDVIVGAQIGGVGASDMVSELALAIESGMNAEDIALTIHPHPSLGEITMDASELALGLPIHT
ncbi:MAG: dihydrolipoyl dehydrogenase [Tetragenococcus halophilus]|uniref:Dihydrolipoyl dehydrogenase n=3 Tax=Tetragenococcus halophilus TaxID=51669 RepID=A0A2H6CVN0_TETHA|nr:dihydrolipoyl dehydrogenase [Tetragenococcus halophilus]AOF48934.1 dihydrolipoamide dehydrogenase [Tetragenococcus halophilus]MCF1602178.1 dihydrolipoyl dehydrogenase [Tetragenococcus halophilus]MCF1676164.1 dihydrolipoyl dehydrogenase [Tetragenococcus halophilus]MCO7026330.1 dihydrolipoyl dehydrogenase [Tetragenococcus halophilus]MCO8284031.1 dihydrolipoyl dehydrogenase [Tetragenococcus halophilus]